MKTGNLKKRFSDNPRISFSVPREVMTNYELLIPWGIRAEVMKTAMLLVLDLFHTLGRDKALSVLNNDNVCIGIKKQSEEA